VETLRGEVKNPMGHWILHICEKVKVECLLEFRHFGVGEVEEAVILESLHHELLVHKTLKRPIVVRSFLEFGDSDTRRLRVKSHQTREKKNRDQILTVDQDECRPSIQWVRWFSKFLALGKQRRRPGQKSRKENLRKD
jgi:hypothetical protein